MTCLVSSDQRFLENGLFSAAWGYEVWDGTSRDVRDSYPTSLEQHRVVQYDSCRGLEGWLVVNRAFDRLFEYKSGSFDFLGEMQEHLFESEEDQRRRSALRWCMIPLTRAIDTQVLHLEDPSSEFSRAESGCLFDSRRLHKFINENSRLRGRFFV